MQTSKKSPQTPMALWSTVTANHFSSSGITVCTYLCNMKHSLRHIFVTIITMSHSHHKTPCHPPGLRWCRSLLWGTPPCPQCNPPAPREQPPAEWGTGTSHKSPPSVWIWREMLNHGKKIYIPIQTSATPLIIFLAESDPAGREGRVQKFCTYTHTRFFFIF